MRKIKIIAILLLVICFIITATNCAPTPSQTPPDNGDTEGTNNNVGGEETGDKNDTGTPEEGNQPGSGGNSDEENQPPAGDDNPEGNNPGSPENNEGENKPGDKIDMDYETLLSLTEAEQVAFFLSFDRQEDFFKWYSAALEKYKEEHPGVDTDGDINLDLFG